MATHCTTPPPAAALMGAPLSTQQHFPATSGSISNMETKSQSSFFFIIFEKKAAFIRNVTTLGFHEELKVKVADK